MFGRSDTSDYVGFIQANNFYVSFGTDIIAFSKMQVFFYIFLHFFYQASNPLYLRHFGPVFSLPPAAGRFNDIIPLRRSAILPGGFFVS